MKEESGKRDLITISEIQKELYVFLASKNKAYLTLPQCIRPQNPCRVIITIKHLLPLLSQAQVESKPKELVIKHLIQLLKDPQDTVRQLTNFFAESGVQQLEPSLKSDITLVNSLSKLISLPTILINLINDPKVSLVSIFIREIQVAKSNLNLFILDATSNMKVEERLIITNKLLVLKEQKTVVEYFLKGDLEALYGIFDHLSKQGNIIKYLYVKLLNQTQAQSKGRLKDVLKALANRCSKVQSSILSLLNMNELQHYAGQRYKIFYDIFYETNQRPHIIKDLLVWWAVSKNFIVTKVHAKVRCNLLALIIESMGKQELHANDYIVSITEGIKKRLTDGQSKEFALLIWKVLGKKLELQLTEDIKKAQYFVIESKPPLGTVSNHKEVQQKQSRVTTIQQEKPQIPMIVPAQKHESSDEQEQASSETSDVIKIEPKNIYDCILGLRNPHRKDMALKKLATIINKYKQDLVLMWNSLLRELLSPLKEQYTPILVQLFTLRPEQFIESVVSFFMNRQNNIGERVYLIQVLKIGIDELSSIQDEKEEEEDQGFYFKKVKSRYFKETQQPKLNKKQEPKTRRWGHTRIAYQNSVKGNVSLDFLKKQTAINRFYPIANLLYFKVIDVLSLNIVDSLRQHQVYVHALLKLLAIFISNIKNHFDKYIIVSDCSSHCVKIVKELIDNSKRENNRYEETGGITLMLALQILNKISLVVDKYVPDGIIDNLKQAIEGARKLPNYGMSSILSMIQSNIYQRVYMQGQPE